MNELKKWWLKMNLAQAFKSVWGFVAALCRFMMSDLRRWISWWIADVQEWWLDLNVTAVFSCRLQNAKDHLRWGVPMAAPALCLTMAPCFLLGRLEWLTWARWAIVSGVMLVFGTVLLFRNLNQTLWDRRYLPAKGLGRIKRNLVFTDSVPFFVALGVFLGLFFGKVLAPAEIWWPVGCALLYVAFSGRLLFYEAWQPYNANILPPGVCPDCNKPAAECECIQPHWGTCSQCGANLSPSYYCTDSTCKGAERRIDQGFRALGDLVTRE